MEPIELTKEQALAALWRNEDGGVHVQTSSGFFIFGCDWSKEDIEKTIEKAKSLQIGGNNCRAMEHGLVIFDEDGESRYFARAKEEKLAEYEKEAKK